MTLSSRILLREERVTKYVQENGVLLYWLQTKAEMQGFPGPDQLLHRPREALVQPGYSSECCWVEGEGIGCLFSEGGEGEERKRREREKRMCVCVCDV